MSILMMQNEPTAGYRQLFFRARNWSDGKTPVTGLTFAASDIQISKNGGSFANSTGAVTEVGQGFYYYTFTSSELSTLGITVLSIPAVTSMLPVASQVQVVSFEPYAMQTQFADTLLVRDISATAEGHQALFSILNMVLKAVSKVSTSGNHAITYQTDGVTVAMTQAITTNASDLPIDSIGVGF